MDKSPFFLVVDIFSFVFVVSCCVCFIEKFYKVNHKKKQ